MISKLKKNSIDLYKLKTPKDLSHVENYFDLFLKKNFFKENKINKKFLFIKKKNIPILIVINRINKIISNDSIYTKYTIFFKTQFIN